MRNASLRRAAGAGALLLAAGALPGCTDWAGYDVDVAAGKVPQFATMRRDVVPDPYEMLRTPPEGTVPLVSPNGDVPLAYSQADLQSLPPELQGSNPLPASAEVLARGQAMYLRHCSVCHGDTGMGDGTVVQPADGHPRFPFATPLAQPATQANSDGYLYAVIDVGRGLMPPYGARITHLDRWAIVHYVRQLGGGAGAGVQTAPAVTPAGEAAQTAPPEAAGTQQPLADTPAVINQGQPDTR